MADDLTTRLVRLRDALLGVALPLPLPGADAAAGTRDEAVQQVEDYLLPRLAHLEAPLLAVLGGSTGSGKSTLTNSLVGEEVSTAGVLRPTTRAPVLVHHPDDAAWFSGEGVLGDLPRTTGERGTGQALHVVASARLPRGLGLLDAPDIDSVEVANHELATQLLGAADLWLFVTTAARYADAVPWDHLARAAERGVAIAVVVNRIPPSPDGSAMAAVTADVRRMLDVGGLPGARLFALEEVPLVDGRLGGAEHEVRAWLEQLVADADARTAVVRQSLQGAVASLAPRAGRVLEAAAAQRDAAAALDAVAVARADAAAARVGDQLGSGVLLRGEVLERFREQVGTAQWMDRLQRGVGRLRDRVGSLFSGGEPPVEAARGQLRSNLVGLVDDALASAVEEVVGAWQSLPGGRQVLDAGGPVAASTPADLRLVEESVAAWQDRVVALVRERAGSKLAVARGLSLGVNGVGVALMTVLFASTGGLTGGEVAVAGGTAAVSHAVLSAVFGEQAVRDLAAAARRDLMQRVGSLAEARVGRLRARLDDLPGDAAVTDLRDAVRELTS
jgi:energy-coupling factor transporter ATP-binding protein EcfA2